MNYVILIWREANENLGQRDDSWETLYVGDDRKEALDIYREYHAEGRKLKVCKECVLEILL